MILNARVQKAWNFVRIFHYVQKNLGYLHKFAALGLRLEAEMMQCGQSSDDENERFWEKKENSPLLEKRKNLWINFSTQNFLQTLNKAQKKFWKIRVNAFSAKVLVIRKEKYSKKIRFKQRKFMRAEIRLAKSSARWVAKN